MTHPAKHLDGLGKCCGMRPMAFSKTDKGVCSVCYAEFDKVGHQAPSWAWRAVSGGFEATKPDERYARRAA